MYPFQRPDVDAAADILGKRLRTTAGQQRGGSAGRGADISPLGVAAPIPNHRESLLAVEVLDAHIAEKLFGFVVDGNEDF